MEEASENGKESPHYVHANVLIDILIFTFLASKLEDKRIIKSRHQISPPCNLTYTHAPPLKSGNESQMKNKASQLYVYIGPIFDFSLFQYSPPQLSEPLSFQNARVFVPAVKKPP